VGSDFFFMTDNSNLVTNTVDTTALHGLDIRLPARGNYTIAVSSRDSSPYVVTVHGYATDGSLATAAVWTGQGAEAPAVTVSYGMPPTVQSLQRTGIHAQPTSLVLTFSEALNTASATNVANYTVLAPGPDGRFGTHDHRTIRIRSAVYNPATDTVTLTPVHRLNWHRRYKIEVNGSSPTGLTDLFGNLLNGVGNGKPGSNYAAVFRHWGIDPTYHAPRGPRTPKEHQQPKLALHRS
jgi:hypothetical protein